VHLPQLHLHPRWHRYRGEGRLSMVPERHLSGATAHRHVHHVPVRRPRQRHPRDGHPLSCTSRVPRVHQPLPRRPLARQAPGKAEHRHHQHVQREDARLSIGRLEAHPVPSGSAAHLDRRDGMSVEHGGVPSEARGHLVAELGLARLRSVPMVEPGEQAAHAISRPAKVTLLSAPARNSSVKFRLARFCFFGSDSMDTLYLPPKASTKLDQAQASPRWRWPRAPFLAVSPAAPCIAGSGALRASLCVCTLLWCYPHHSFTSCGSAHLHYLIEELVGRSKRWTHLTLR